MEFGSPDDGKAEKFEDHHIDECCVCGGGTGVFVCDDCVEQELIALARPPAKA